MDRTSDLPILGLLMTAPMHGYALKQRLSHYLGYFGSTSSGAIYPALRRLEREGCIELVRPAEDRGPASATRQERRRRERFTYAITPLGRRRFAELMASTAIPLTLRLLFFHLLPAPDRLSVLVSHRAYLARTHAGLAQMLEHTRAAMQDLPPAQREECHYGFISLQYAVERLMSDLQWLDALIAEEQRSQDAAASKG